MILIAIYLHALSHFHQIAIHTHVQVAFSAHGLEEFTVVSFTATHQWGEDKNLFTLVAIQNHVEHFLFRIFHHFLARHVTIGFTSTCKEQTYVVVDLCGGTDSGTGILVGGFLLDTDHG